ncbi:Ribose-phosphate pyrophosphokinase [Candidatus Cyrtobacter comes]|uniref:Ribose-phosphate pyrophosphokinase n=1 Tax=Candidatus Cyrtobacter comes TaxID=675776 RepID=A0ABU5L786_9RICK|nr:phosphoribosyltransferase family protein [Candidatus Cyrtobacter comes]MDZ5761988.1 Ribose-phosphate pyrophosphokinase [Candidatus Cyrtobacter comes]
MVIIGDNLSYDIKRDICTEFDTILVNNGKFSNGEVFSSMNTKIADTKHEPIYYLDSVSGNFSESILQILSNCHLISSLFSSKINLILTFMPFMRHDKSFQDECVISKNCSLIPRLLKIAGVDKLITLDIHSIESMQSCINVFGADFINLLPLKLFAQDIIKILYNKELDLIVLGSTDGLDKQNDRAFLNVQRLQKMINCKEVFWIKKQRAFGEITSSLVADNIKDKVCIILDDIISSGKSALNTAYELKNAGARKIFIYATHLINSTTEDFDKLLLMVDRIVVTNSISIKCNQLAPNIDIRLINISNMLKELLIYGSKTIF